jgi:PKD repeat protein
VVAAALAALVALVAPPPVAQAQNPAVTIAVDAAADRRSIDPRIYGVAYADAAALSDLNVPLHRRGGNNTTRYNWQQNADNRANDWYYQSIAYASATPGADADAFVSSTRAAGAEAAVTIPTIGWVAKLGPNRAKTCSFSIAKYGPQTGNDWQWFPDAGNGVRTSGGYVTGNDPNDASVPADATFQRAWVDHLVGRWGAAASGGVRYYILDNEPSIWHATHRDVHPVGATMDEVLEKTIDYAAAIKGSDPGALVVGPEEWGWSGYFWSGYDQQAGAANGWSRFPDREAHGNWDYLPWLLDQLRQRHEQTGTRLLDVFTVHYYPQGGEFSDDVSTSMQLRRNRSTRSLWDPAYTDESWINDEVRLVPRLREWVASYYPGTRTGITEYNWGAEGHINGATAQADILGIFGREGLDMAARWTTPGASTPTYKAMKMYRNYDGARSTFGDVSVRATVPDPDTLSAFAAERTSDGALTVMVVNKALSGSTPATISLAGFPPAGTAERWQLTSSNAIVRLADVGTATGAISTTLPPQSITLFVIPRATSSNAPPVAAVAASPVSGAAPLAVAFDASGSSDADGTVVAYAWAFGDGATGSGATASHTYAAGAYVATLTVTDDLGATGTASVAISVAPDPTLVAAPTNLAARALTNRRARLTWTDNASNETGVEVERAPKGSSAFVRVATTPADATSFEETLARGTYVYRVRAVTSGAVSAYSNQAQVRIK